MPLPPDGERLVVSYQVLAGEETVATGSAVFDRV